MKEQIIDERGRRSGRFQIISVRKHEDYGTAGHIPEAVNTLWIDIVKDENPARQDLDKTAVVYPEKGQSGQMAATLLNLLDYRAVESLFGMMDWNSSNVKPSSRWDGEADFPVDKL